MAHLKQADYAKMEKHIQALMPKPFKRKMLRLILPAGNRIQLAEWYSMPNRALSKKYPFSYPLWHLIVGSKTEKLFDTGGSTGRFIKDAPRVYGGRMEDYIAQSKRYYLNQQKNKTEKKP